MVLKDISLRSPQENILLDEVLLHLAERGESGEALRFWESLPTFIVLGRTGKIEDDVYVDRAHADKIPILRRCSGGGTVVQGPGCLNFALVLSKEHHPILRDLRQSYRYILGKVILAFGRLGHRVAFKPISDLAIGEDERKISGNAQRRGRRYILHHGTVLYNFDFSLIERYLKVPQSVPEYRRARNHHLFLANIALSSDVMKEAIAKEFLINTRFEKLDPLEEKCLAEFKQQKTIEVHCEEF